MSEPNSEPVSRGRFGFERECRTASSEGYSIVEGNQIVGRIDLHFTAAIVQGSLSVAESFTEEQIEELIEHVDEHLVMTADTPRGDFIVSIFQGRSLGTFSDEDFGHEHDPESPDEPNGQ
jgi:hypothetical protein